MRACSRASADPKATRLRKREHIARDILERISPQMLVVDEVHHLLAGSAQEQRALLNLLKYLAKKVKMSFLALGTSDAPVAFQADAQIHSRYRPLELPRWSESDDFRTVGSQGPYRPLR